MFKFVLLINLYIRFKKKEIKIQKQFFQLHAVTDIGKQAEKGQRQRQTLSSSTFRRILEFCGETSPPFFSGHQSEEMKILNISFPRVRNKLTTFHTYSLTLVPQVTTGLQNLYSYIDLLGIIFKKQNLCCLLLTITKNTNVQKIKKLRPLLNITHSAARQFCL